MPWENMVLGSTTFFLFSICLFSKRGSRFNILCKLCMHSWKEHEHRVANSWLGTAEDLGVEPGDDGL